MSLSGLRSPSAAMLLAATALVMSVLATPVAAQRSDGGPFARLNGSWKGSGQVRLEGGQTERITCRAYYLPRDSGSSLGLTLRCASNSFAINLRSSMTAAGGRVSGSWEETTFGASGSIVGRASSSNLAVSIAGGGLSGSMSVSFGSSTQQVSINTSGTALRGVSISLSRAS